MHILNSYEPHLPSPAHSDVTLVVVLTQDATSQYAVYWAANCTKEYAAAYGTKLNYKHALMYFPSLERKDYRR